MLAEALLMSTLNMIFYREKRKIFCGYSPLSGAIDGSNKQSDVSYLTKTNFHDDNDDLVFYFPDSP